MRIVLVLVYQHRPGDIDLTALLDASIWNSSSMGLVNLVCDLKVFDLLIVLIGLKMDGM